jgi:hypothetical protein
LEVVLGVGAIWGADFFGEGGGGEEVVGDGAVLG